MLVFSTLLFFAFFGSIFRWFRVPVEPSISEFTIISQAFFWVSASGPRAVSAALHTPRLGGDTLSQGAKNQSRHHLAPQWKLRSPKLKYEAVEISEVSGHFERKVLMLYSYIGPLWKRGIYTLQLPLGTPLKAKKPTHTLQLMLGPFESKVLCTLQLQRGARGTCLTCLPLNTPLCLTLTMILCENMKPIEHLLPHPIFVLSHLTCVCKHCNGKLSLYYWTHGSCWWAYHSFEQFFIIKPRHAGVDWKNRSGWKKPSVGALVTCGKTPATVTWRKHLKIY